MSRRSRRSGGARFKTLKRSTLSKLKTRQLKRAMPSGLTIVYPNMPISRFGSVRHHNPRNKKSRARATIRHRAEKAGKAFHTAVKSHTKNVHKSKMNNLNGLFSNFGFGGVKSMSH